MRTDSKEKYLRLKKILIVSYLLVLSAIPINFYGQTMNCSKFRDGIFMYADKKMGNYTIKRDGKYQIEIYQNKKYKFIVNWVDDCTYTLTPTKKTYKENPRFTEIGVLTVQIIEVRENSYVQTSKSQFLDRKLTDEIIKIR
jgi:hypothetical protein